MTALNSTNISRNSSLRLVRAKGDPGKWILTSYIALCTVRLPFSESVLIVNGRTRDKCELRSVAT